MKECAPQHTQTHTHAHTHITHAVKLTFFYEIFHLFFNVFVQIVKPTRFNCCFNHQRRLAWLGSRLILSRPVCASEKSQVNERE